MWSPLSKLNPRVMIIYCLSCFIIKKSFSPIRITTTTSDWFLLTDLTRFSKFYTLQKKQNIRWNLGIQSKLNQLVCLDCGSFLDLCRALMGEYNQVSFKSGSVRAQPHAYNPAHPSCNIDSNHQNFLSLWMVRTYENLII